MNGGAAPLAEAAAYGKEAAVPERYDRLASDFAGRLRGPTV